MKKKLLLSKKSQLSRKYANESSFQIVCKRISLVPVEKQSRCILTRGWEKPISFGNRDPAMYGENGVQYPQKRSQKRTTNRDPVIIWRPIYGRMEFNKATSVRLDWLRCETTN